MPKTPKAIELKKRIDFITRELIQVGLVTDQCFSLIKRGTGNAVEIIPDTSKSSISLKSIPYKEIYDVLSCSRAYNMKMIDGGLLVLRYTFKNDVLTKHVLGFYPSPDLLEFQDNADFYLEDDVYADIVEPQIMPSPIRFDYDPEAAEPLTHPRSHMTIGQYTNCRIPVVAPLTPDHFVALILRSFYNTAQRKYSESIHFDEVSAFEKSLYSEEESSSFFCVPHRC